MASVIITALSSAALFSFVQFLITRHDNKNGKNAEILKRLDGIEKKQDKSEKDSCRTQLLLMLADYPDSITEIMKLAEHYFRDLSGDWYMTSIFNRWLEKLNIGKPEWFDPAA